MVVECYTADVYCDDHDHDHRRGGCCNSPDVFTGKNKRETDRQRLAYGWVRINGKDYCPVCKVRHLKNRPAAKVAKGGGDG